MDPVRGDLRHGRPRRRGQGLFFSGEEPADLRNADYADLAALALDVVAAALAIAVVVTMTARQSARARAVAIGSEPLAAITGSG